MLMIRDRKDPRNKTGNDQRIPLFAATGFDAWALVTEQAKELGHARGRIFPYNSKSVGTAFRRACVEVSVKDLHFHDLRHEGTSRLFEAGLAIEQVSLVTGHKDWKMLPGTRISARKRCTGSPRRAPLPRSRPAQPSDPRVRGVPSRPVTGLEVEREAFGRPSREKTHEYRDYRCRA
jgi:hypothetical protein